MSIYTFHQKWIQKHCWSSILTSTALHCIALLYSTLLYFTLLYSTLHYPTLHCTTLCYTTWHTPPHPTSHYTTPHHTTLLQSNTVQSRAWQCNAKQISTIQYYTMPLHGIALYCKVLQRSTIQYNALRYNTSSSLCWGWQILEVVGPFCCMLGFHDAFVPSVCIFPMPSSLTFFNVVRTCTIVGICVSDMCHDMCVIFVNICVIYHEQYYWMLNSLIWIKY